MKEESKLNLDQQAGSNRKSGIHHKIWSLAGPMMLSNISLPLLGLVDTAVMGHLERAIYLAAVSVGAMIIHFIFWGFGFLRMATVGVAAQAHGAGDFAASRLLLARASFVAFTIAILLVALQQPLLQLASGLVAADQAITAQVSHYFAIRIWSAPATLLTYVLLGWFLGVQQARTVLLIMVFINLLNIVLDIIFVPVMGMTVDGVAMASVIAEYCGLFLALFLLRGQLLKMPATISWAQVLKVSEIMALLHLNTNIFIRTIALLFAFAYFTTLSARSGELVMAANAILLQFITFMAYVLDAYAHAAEAMVGEALGQKNRAHLLNVVRACLGWSLISALVFMLFYLLAGNGVIALLTDLQPVRAFAAEYRYWLALMPLIAVWSYLYDGVFVGATWSREMRDVMLISSFFIYLPVITVTRDWGNHGLWFSLTLFLLVRGALMAVYFQRKQRSLALG